MTTLEAGRKLGPYEILGPLGAGGMGEVYRARDPRLDRTVAIKVLPAHLADNAELKERFDREAKAVSGLNHPHICSLFDVGEVDSLVYLVMEYLEGETLAERLSKSKFATDDVLKYGIQIAEALDAAHRSGVIHRDLKPGNVMITPSGAKLLDFGLAKATKGADDEANSLTMSPTMASPLTAAGTLVGTFQYMAPEQLEGGEADVRSDVFALGTTLYEMVTGRTAFEGKTQASVIAAVLEREPTPLQEIQPLAPPSLVQLIAQCMRKNPEDRRQSVHDIALELRWIRDGGSQAGVPTPVVVRRKSRERLAWTLVGVLGVATLAALLGLLFRPAGEMETTPLQAELMFPPGLRPYYRSEHPGPPTLSPDGRFVAFAASEGVNSPQEIYVRDLQTGQLRPVEGTSGAGYPFWSPDSEHLGFFADGYLSRVATIGGAPSRLCEARQGKGGSWGKDGTILFAPGPASEIFRVSDQGGEPLAVTALDSLSYTSHRFPQLLPGGDSFLYLARKKGDDAQACDVHWASIDGSDDRVIKDSKTQAAWVDGQLVFENAGALFSQPFDTSEGLLGAPRRLADNVAVIPGANRAVFDAHPTTLVFQSDVFDAPMRRLCWYDRRGQRLAFLGEPAYYDQPRLSPDGGSVAFLLRDEPGEPGDLWLTDVDQGLPTRLTFDDGRDEWPVWSADGKRIAFAAEREGQWGIYSLAIDKNEQPRLLAETDSGPVPEDWTRDGKYIAYQSAGDVWILPADPPGEPYPLISGEFPEWAPSFSPDGKWIAFVSMESGKPELYVTSFPEVGRKWRLSNQGGSSARWNRAGTEIVFVTQNSSLYRVEISLSPSNMKIGEPELLFAESAAREGDATSDNQRFLLAIVEEAETISPLRLVRHWAGLSEPSP